MQHVKSNEMKREVFPDNNSNRNLNKMKPKTQTSLEMRSAPFVSPRKNQRIFRFPLISFGNFYYRWLGGSKRFVKTFVAFECKAVVIGRWRVAGVGPWDFTRIFMKQLIQFHRPPFGGDFHLSVKLSTD
jgi:hypothetical protein